MSFLWVSSLVLKFGRDDQSLGKPGLIVHINEMADKSDNTSGATPLYRERVRPISAHPPAHRCQHPNPPKMRQSPVPDTPKPENPANKPGELGGPKGPEPTRFRGLGTRRAGASISEFPTGSVHPA